MRGGEARQAARRWVARAAAADPHYRGAYFTGSINDLPAAAELPPSSDVDLVVADARADPGLKLGKFRHDGALLEVTHLPADTFADPEAVLADYHLAGAFRADSIIDDPTGRLGAVHERVARDFADPTWVRRRYADARARIVDRLAAVDPDGPWHEQVTRWLFGTGVTAHLPLVAALRNPTIRLRYPAARAALTDLGRPDVYPELLRLLGAAHLTATRVDRHVDLLGRAFDAVAAVARTPFFFTSDLSPEARPIAIDGSRELVARGDHREAMFWVVATFARCQAVFEADAPSLAREREGAFRAAAADLGIVSHDDIRRRAAEVRAALPVLDRDLLARVPG